MHLIQLGVALFDEGGNTPWPGCCWQFNFSDFDPDVDASSPDSIELLTQSGHDFQQYRRHGIDARRCAYLVCVKLFCQSYSSKYVTFHGLYDVAFVIKMITRAPLPNTLNEFSDLVRTIFGQIYDLKYISRFCGGLRRGEIGLVGLSRLLNFEPVGIRHQAAYDSLLIGALFNEMKQRRHNVEDDRSASVLYGIENRCVENRRTRMIDRRGWPYARRQQHRLAAMGFSELLFSPLCKVLVTVPLPVPIFVIVEALSFVHCRVFLSNLCFTRLTLLKGLFYFYFLSGLTMAIDTEFPGFIRDTPRNATEEERYNDVKHNVDNMHLIQLGVALFDEGGNTPWPGCCWQFNFSDFDPDVDASSPDSIELLTQSGHDFQQYRRHGIDARRCAYLVCVKLFCQPYSSSMLRFTDSTTWLCDKDDHPSPTAQHLERVL
ncbi:unnamed protein product [Musa acuminata var. zebrina]